MRECEVQNVGPWWMFLKLKDVKILQHQTLDKSWKSLDALVRRIPPHEGLEFQPRIAKKVRLIDLCSTLVELWGSLQAQMRF